MWTDTHLHLDAPEYLPDQAGVVSRSRQLHVTRFVIPAVHPSNFDAVKQLAHRTPGAVYCLGIHPLWVAQCDGNALAHLQQAVQSSVDDPLFAGIGEIGLDGFVPNPNWPLQWQFYEAQLQMAKQFNLPVVLHVRKSQDLILKGLRAYRPPGGIAHAFNGSDQQADWFVKLGMCVGFGGACTFTRAKQIRRLLTALPADHLVLETDGPDIPPEWINHQRNEPSHLPRIAEVVAELRGLSVAALSEITQRNAERALPALQRVYPTPPSSP